MGGALLWRPCAYLPNWGAGLGKSGRNRPRSKGKVKGQVTAPAGMLLRERAGLMMLEVGLGLGSRHVDRGALLLLLCVPAPPVLMGSWFCLNVKQQKI